MSHTPRTDAEANDASLCDQCVPANFASQLERELAQSHAQYDELVKEKIDIELDAVRLERELAAITAEQDALREDKARLDWLEKSPPGVLIECDETSTSVTTGTWSLLNADKLRGSGKTLRAAIDAAREEKP